MNTLILFVGLAIIIFQLDRLTNTLKQMNLNITITNNDE